MVGLQENVVAQALFLSDLQPSACPDAAAVWGAVERALARYGSEGCGPAVAGEYGSGASRRRRGCGGRGGWSPTAGRWPPERVPVSASACLVGLALSRVP
ncbi:hypothetical protein GCM10010124_32680 [Pilimelia terevasa]|uniref:Uncharacterized protein n=1 Tax=Pilimelia terevasa TaxID=53372 RepID=A0A8J3BVH7_9ACTN|nr:hypothetical protein GCM10010124_32680 [Pilimelia terevasa]